MATDQPEPKGQPYIVGEKQAELFVPPGAGWLLPDQSWQEALDRLNDEIGRYLSQQDPPENPKEQD